MKTAFFTDTYLPHLNGVATWLYAMNHAKKKWEMSVFGPMDHEDVIKVPGVRFPIFPEYRIALSKGRLARFIESEGFDVIHNHTPYSMFYYGNSIARKLKLPVVGTFHTDPAAVFGALISTESRAGKAASYLTWKYLVGTYNNCDVVIAISSWVKRELTERGLKKPMEVIPNGIDVKRFSPKTDTEPLLKKFKIPRDKKKVLFTGRLENKKDPVTFVKACLRSKEDAVFMIGGKGSLEGTLREMIKGDERFVFLGYLPGAMIPQMYTAADIFAFPSEMETQGLVMAEAMASGTPVIATDVGAARDMLSDEWIIPHKDPKALQEKMDYLLKNDSVRKKLAKEGRRTVEEKFSIEANVEELGRLYRELKR